MTPIRTLRRLTGIVAVGLLVTLAASCGDDGGRARSSTTSTTITTVVTGDTTPPTTAPTTTAAPADDGTILVEFAGGAVVGGVQRYPVDVGSPVRIEVTADVADEVHLHGYDVVVDVEPGQPGVLELNADIPGVFEAELEDAHLPLFELEVS